jgi:hypothetical protein
MGKKNFFKNSGNKAPFLKEGASDAVPRIDDFPPAFSFEKMQDGSGNSFNCCEDDDRLALAMRMFMLSRIAWKEIRQAPASGLGSEQIPRYRIKRAVPSSVTEDVDSFTALHFVGKKRFLGYRIGQIFYILWVDHDFETYNHGS